MRASIRRASASDEAQGSGRIQTKSEEGEGKTSGNAVRQASVCDAALDESRLARSRRERKRKPTTVVSLRCSDKGDEHHR